jgi:hypothetical protein
MDAPRFDRLTRSLAGAALRRGLLRGLAAFALTGAGLPRVATAKKKRKKIKRNAFGCVNVGKFCKNNSQCCSGICQGKKGKKTCKAHDTGGCQAGHAPCNAPQVPCTTDGGKAGFCATTTGNAGYCTTGTGGECTPCTRDADCREICGAGAACIACLECAGGSTCATTDACVFSLF